MKTNTQQESAFQAGFQAGLNAVDKFGEQHETGDEAWELYALTTTIPEPEPEPEPEPDTALQERIAQEVVNEINKMALTPIVGKVTFSIVVEALIRYEAARQSTYPPFNEACGVPCDGPYDNQGDCIIHRKEP